MISFSLAELHRFIHSSAIGISSFLFDLLLLYVFVEFFYIDYRIATPLAFILATSINYSVARYIIFPTTERTFTDGYTRFISLAVASMLLITALVWLLVTFVGLYYVVARILVAAVVGIANYCVNVLWVFKSPLDSEPHLK